MMKPSRGGQQTAGVAAGRKKKNLPCQKHGRRVSAGSGKRLFQPLMNLRVGHTSFAQAGAVSTTDAINDRFDRDVRHLGFVWVSGFSGGRGVVQSSK